MIRLGTRRSRLATAQARIVADQLGGAELVPITTEGDRDAARSFAEIGTGRGVFTREIERALLDGDVDAAVHSAKDLTGDMPDGLVLGAILERADPRDAVLRRLRFPRRDPGRCAGRHLVRPAGGPAGGASARHPGGAAARQRRHPPRQARRR